MGTDYPFPWIKTAVDHILATSGLSDGERVAILEETAEKLLAVRARSGEARLWVHPGGGAMAPRTAAMRGKPDVHGGRGEPPRRLVSSHSRFIRLAIPMR
jgi:hypothetical protein